MRQQGSDNDAPILVEVWDVCLSETQASGHNGKEHGKKKKKRHEGNSSQGPMSQAGDTNLTDQMCTLTKDIN